jgi:hypothetical protein
MSEEDGEGAAGGEVPVGQVVLNQQGRSGVEYGEEERSG